MSVFAASADWLDHLFVLVPDQSAAEALLARSGLDESYRRSHPGQGTRNICAYFDNSYLELLWIDDPAAAAGVMTARLALPGRAAGGCPFGLSLRVPAGQGLPPGQGLPFPGWDYRPAYLPPGLTLLMGQGSADPDQPLIFTMPGSRRPDAWPDGRAGQRQRAAGLTEAGRLTITFPAGIIPGPEITRLADLGLVRLESGPAWRARWTFGTLAGGECSLDLPEFIWHGDAP